MSATKPPHPLDLNPRHPRQDLHRFINELNVKYNLGVPIPDPGLSPSKRKEQETPATRLYIRLEVHFYQGGLEVLQQLMKDFDSEARQSCSQWVKKPRGDPDTLPASGNGPLASNQPQRECLQSIFHKVLDRCQPKRSFNRTRSGPAAFSMEKLPSVQPKRAAETIMAKSPIKRSKLAGQTASAAQVPISAAIPKTSDLFAASKLPSERPRQGSNRTVSSFVESFEALKRSTTYSTSVNTDASSRFAFSSAKLESSTQETVEASSQEQRRSLPTSQDQFQPTSTMVDVLNESFNDHEASFDCHSRATGLKHAPCHPTQTTDYSCPPSSALVEALRSTPDDEPQVKSEQTVTESLATHKSGSFLGQDIWRTLWCIQTSSPFSSLTCFSALTGLAQAGAVSYSLGGSPDRSSHGS